MQTPALFDQLMTHLRTTADVSQVIHCLEEFSGTFYEKKPQQEQQQIFRKLPNAIEEILIPALTSEQPTHETQIQIKRHVDELLDKLRTCKSIKLTIAFQADDATVTYFSDWIKKNVNAMLLIDLQFDKSIVGGAMLIASGVYKDYSVRKKLSNRFQIQRDEIMGLLD